VIFCLTSPKRAPFFYFFKTCDQEFPQNPTLCLSSLKVKKYPPTAKYAKKLPLIVLEILRERRCDFLFNGFSIWFTAKMLNSRLKMRRILGKTNYLSDLEYSVKCQIFGFLVIRYDPLSVGHYLDVYYIFILLFFTCISCAC
jgi:hypothetical protein